MAADPNGVNTSIPYPAIVFLCILGAAAVVVIVGVVVAHYGAPERKETVDNPGPDGLTQAQYMRMIRLRNFEILGRSYGFTRPAPKMSDIESRYSPSERW